jgi:hypothetical protein
MEQISSSIYALESKNELSVEEEEQLQRLLLSRSDLIAALKTQSTASPSEEALSIPAALSQPSSGCPPPSFLDSVLSTVAEASRASVSLAKGVAALLVESAAETTRLCTPPPPTLQQALQQLHASCASLPPCVLDLLPHELKPAPPQQRVAAVGSSKQLLTNLCEYTLLMDSSIHGASNKRFHELCDCKGATFALFLSHDNLFGYFLSKSTGMGIQRAPRSFMFTVFRDGCYRPARYHMLDSNWDVLPSATPCSLPVGWSSEKSEGGETYYFCHSTQHVQWQSPLIDRQQMHLGPRCRAFIRVKLSLPPLLLSTLLLPPLCLTIVPSFAAGWVPAISSSTSTT